MTDQLTYSRYVYNELDFYQFHAPHTPTQHSFLLFKNHYNAFLRFFRPSLRGSQQRSDRPPSTEDPGLGSWTFTSYSTGNAPVGAWRSFTLQYSGSTTEITCDWNNFHGQLVDKCSDPAFSYTLGLRTADSQGECDSEGIDGWH